MNKRTRFELIFTSVWLAIGLFGLPALIFLVGTALLGPYADNRGLGRFYADFFGDLATPAARAWAIALGPLVLITLIRLVFLGTPQRKPSEDESAQARPERPVPDRKHEESRRVEPRVSE